LNFQKSVIEKYLPETRICSSLKKLLKRNRNSLNQTEPATFFQLCRFGLSLGIPIFSINLYIAIFKVLERNGKRWSEKCHVERNALLSYQRNCLD
jgi:hypothetical protein